MLLRERSERDEYYWNAESQQPDLSEILFTQRSEKEKIGNGRRISCPNI
jgi:hypothetical protein